MINAIIVENERKHLENLSRLLKENFPEINVIATCATLNDSIRAIRKFQPDLLFLDVELEPGSGFEVLEQTRNQSYEIIFITAFNKYAVTAFKFCALDYIIKPVGKDDLQIAFDRYKNFKLHGTKKNIEALLHNYRQIDKTLQIIGINVLRGIDFLIVSDIICCKASGNYTEFYLTGKRRITATKTLKSVEDLLTEHVFFRVHDAWLINLHHIKKYKSDREGGLAILTEFHPDYKDGIPVSRRKKDEFLKILSGLKIISNK
jgi:two-component system, LytTR family, response regulator